MCCTGSPGRQPLDPGQILTSLAAPSPPRCPPVPIEADTLSGPYRPAAGRKTALVKRNGLCQVSNLCLLDLRGWDVLTEPGAVSLIPRHWNITFVTVLTVATVMTVMQ